MSTSSEPSEWTPPFLRTARSAAARATTDRTTTDADRAALAVRELAAEVRALRYQLAGGGDPGREGGLLGGIDAAIEHAGRR